MLSLDNKMQSVEDKLNLLGKPVTNPVGIHAANE
jgi:hypothetical protein